jgi:hypothetical protein
MVKRIIALTATAVCTLAVSASAADPPDNTAPAAPPAEAAQAELAPRVLALQAVENAKPDESAAKIEAAIDKLRAAGELEGVNKDELIAQLQAAADSLKANAPQLSELKSQLDGVDGKLLQLHELKELKGLAPGRAPQVYQLDPKAIEELKNNALILKDQALKFYVPRAQGIDPQTLKELQELRVYGDGDKAPRAMVFTPEQLEELKAQALAEADSTQRIETADPALRAQIMQEVQKHQLTKEQIAELHQKIQKLVEQYIEEHAADAGSNNDSSAEDSED